MEAERSSLVAPSLINGWISVLANTPQRDRVDGLVILGVFIQTCRIRLDEGCHLVDKRTGTAGTDAVHTLLDIAALKIDDLGILTTELDGNIGLRCIMLQGSGHGDHFLDKRNTEMLGE